MLKEVQAAELLRRCEAIAGRRLTQVRGNLRRAETRAAAVWELLVLEAAAQNGSVEYEPESGGPDVRMKLPSGRWASIEVAYLNPRFEDIEDRSRAVVTWVNQAVAKKLGSQPPRIHCQFHGERHPAGSKRILPLEHEMRLFLRDPEIIEYLERVAANPQGTHKQRLTRYSVTLTSSPYHPKFNKSVGWGGPPPEQPQVVEEHAAFRVLRNKIRQHKLSEPHLVCIGTDTSSALSQIRWAGQVRLEDALGAAIGSSEEISGVLIADIKSSLPMVLPVTRLARCTAHPTRKSRYPLTEDEWFHIRRLDMNRWKYTFPLPRRDAPGYRYRHTPGDLGHSARIGGNVKVTIPASVVVDALAGRKNLLDGYGGNEEWFGKAVSTCLQEDWSIVACEYQSGDVQTGKPAYVVLELAPPHEDVFWPRG